MDQTIIENISIFLSNTFAKGMKKEKEFHILWYLDFKAYKFFFISMCFNYFPFTNIIHDVFIIR